MLMLGGTPNIFKKIGLNALPVTITQKHSRKALFDKNDPDHYMGPTMFKRLPKLIEDPIAIIASETRNNTSVVAIVEQLINGNQQIAAVYIDGTARIGGKAYDSNVITSTFGKKNALDKLSNAIKEELNNQIGVFYINKTRAANLYARAGVHFPGSALQDNPLLHTIRDAGSPVNMKLDNVTQSRQFTR